MNDGLLRWMEPYVVLVGVTERDENRNYELEQAGLTVIRIRNEDIYKDVKLVLAWIVEASETSSPRPSPAFDEKLRHPRRRELNPANFVDLYFDKQFS